MSVGSAAFAANWLQVLLARTATWVGWSVRSPVRDALLLESTEPKTIARAFAFHRTMDTLGAIAGPLIATLLIVRVPIRTIFLIALIPGLCAVAALLVLVKEKARPPLTHGVWQSVTILPPSFLALLIPIGIFGISNFAPTLLILRTQEMLAPSLGTVIAGTVAAGLYTWSNVAYALVSFPIGVLADRFSKRRILSVGYLLFGLLCFGFIFAQGRLWLLVALFAAVGIYTAIVESGEPALAGTLIGGAAHGSGYGALSFTQGVGDFLSSIIVGALFSFVSPTAGFLFAGAVAMSAALLLWMLRLGSG